jgi:hypothetical protein
MRHKVYNYPGCAPEIAKWVNERFDSHHQVHGISACNCPSAISPASLRLKPPRSIAATDSELCLV